MAAAVVTITVVVVRASKVAVSTVRAEASRVAVISKEAEEVIVQINHVMAEVEIVTCLASQKRSTKKRSRIKYVKHKPSSLVIRAVRA
jgi:hypothetical protein